MGGAQQPQRLGRLRVEAGVFGGRGRRGRVDVAGGPRGGVLGVLALVVTLGDQLVDALLLLTAAGELVGVLERAGELVAGSTGFAHRLDALCVELGRQKGGDLQGYST